MSFDIDEFLLEDDMDEEDRPKGIRGALPQHMVRAVYMSLRNRKGEKPNDAALGAFKITQAVLQRNGYMTGGAEGRLTGKGQTRSKQHATEPKGNVAAKKADFDAIRKRADTALSGKGSKKEEAMSSLRKRSALCEAIVGSAAYRDPAPPVTLYVPEGFPGSAEDYKVFAERSGLLEKQQQTERVYQEAETLLWECSRALQQAVVKHGGRDFDECRSKVRETMAGLRRYMRRVEAITGKMEPPEEPVES